MSVCHVVLLPLLILLGEPPPRPLFIGSAITVAPFSPSDPTFLQLGQHDTVNIIEKVLSFICSFSVSDFFNHMEMRNFWPNWPNSSQLSHERALCGW